MRMVAGIVALGLLAWVTVSDEAVYVADVVNPGW